MNIKGNKEAIKVLRHVHAILASEPVLLPSAILHLVLIFAFYKRISDAEILDLPYGCRWRDISPTNERTLLHHILDNLRKILVQHRELFAALSAFDLNRLFESVLLVSPGAQQSIYQLINKLDFSSKQRDVFEFDSIITGVIESEVKRATRGSVYQAYIGNYFTPSWLEKLLATMLAPKTNEVLFFPFCGTASIVSAFVDYTQKVNALREQVVNPFLPLNIHCMENNSQAWAIAKFRLALMGGLEVEIIKDDPFTSTIKQLSDVICCVPPFGYVPDEVPDWYKIGRERIRVPKRRKEVAFLLATLSQLTKKGRLGIILPVGFTFDESLRKIRRVLLEENLVEAIVQLPEGSFPYTTVKTVLLILDKNRTNENKRSISMGVLPFSTKNAENENNNFHRFLSAYHKSESVENWFVASIEDIQKEDYSLLPFRYVGAVTDELESLLRDKKVKRLEDICRIIRGRKRRPVEDLKGVPFVSTKDLSSDVTEPYLNFEDLNLSSAQTGDHIISQKCILVSLVGRSPKPTIFSPERAHIGTEESDTYIGILPNSNIACLVPNENIVDLEYFYFQLTTSLFKKQYEILSTGVGIPNVSIRSLRSIVIPVLPLQEQREVTRQLKEAFFKEANARLEALRANLNFDAKKQEAEYRIVRHLSHNLRHKITDIQSSFKHIGVFLKEKGLLEDLIQEKLSSDDQVETVGEVIGKSLLELKHMHNLLEKTRDLIIKKINSDDFKLIYLDQLFKEKVIQKANSKNYSIKLSGKTKSQVYIEETNFLEMISNLIKNAELHGFTDTSVKYEIRFDFSESPQSIFIDYSNNGDPLPPEFNLESFYGYGVKRIGSPGEGLGGAFIEKVIMAHKGEMQIISRDPVHFRIMIPKGEGNEQR